MDPGRYWLASSLRWRVGRIFSLFMVRYWNSATDWRLWLQGQFHFCWLALQMKLFISIKILYDDQFFFNVLVVFCFLLFSLNASGLVSMSSRVMSKMSCLVAGQKKNAGLEAIVDPAIVVPGKDLSWVLLFQLNHWMFKTRKFLLFSSSKSLEWIQSSRFVQKTFSLKSKVHLVNLLSWWPFQMQSGMVSISHCVVPESSELISATKSRSFELLLGLFDGALFKNVSR